MVLAEFVDYPGNHAGHADGMNISFDKLPKLLGDCSRGMTKGERIRWLLVEVDADENDSEHLVQFLL